MKSNIKTRIVFSPLKHKDTFVLRSLPSYTKFKRSTINSTKIDAKNQYKLCYKQVNFSWPVGERHKSRLTKMILDCGVNSNQIACHDEVDGGKISIHPCLYPMCMDDNCVFGNKG